MLIADLDAIERNVARMQAYCDEHGVALRPHIKTHKLPELARLQLEAGAVGITCQKLGEAEVMADAGIEDILLSFPLVGEAKAERLAALAARVKMTVVGDSARRRGGSLAGARPARGGGRLPRRVRHRAGPDGRPEPGGGGRPGRARRRARGIALRRPDDLSVAARDGAVAAGGPRGRRGARALRRPGQRRRHADGRAHARARRRRRAPRRHLHLRRPGLHRRRLGAARGLCAPRRRDRRQPADAGAGDHRRRLEDADDGPRDRRHRPRPARRAPRGGGLRAQRGARLRRRQPLRASARDRRPRHDRPQPRLHDREHARRDRACTAAARSSRRCRQRHAER